MTKARAAAERKLEKAERDLSHLGLFGRSRRRADLRGEIALQRSAIRMADEKLVEVDQQAQEARRLAVSAGRVDQSITDDEERAVGRTAPARRSRNSLSIYDVPRPK